MPNIVGSPSLLLDKISDSTIEAKLAAVELRRIIIIGETRDGNMYFDTAVANDIEYNHFMLQGLLTAAQNLLTSQQLAASLSEQDDSSLDTLIASMPAEI